MMMMIMVLILDIDECSGGIDRCSHHCQNTIGFYMCDCRSGYLLNTDGYSCDGT